jgi:hypothetical protein
MAAPQRIQYLQPQTDCPPEHLAFARSFIDSCRFTFAKSVPANPHEYCLKAWVPDPAAYDRFVELIGYYGYNGRFLRVTYRYLNVDGWRYWESPTLDRTGMIINRTRNYDATTGRCCALGEATSGKHHARSCRNYRPRGHT